MDKSDTTGQAIRKYVRKHGSATGPELAEHLGITRQAVNLHLRRLIAAGEIFKTGSTRAARYFPAEAAPAGRSVKRELAFAGLDEAEVYDDIAISLNLSQLSDNVRSIAHYAFTEILNNAIDHSMSDKCAIDVRVDAAGFAFGVRDNGIGVFQSIADKFELDDERAAMIELIKGKTTTKPHAHSGEGIFFVSKVADRFVLRSHRQQIEWNRDRDDVFVSDTRFLEGTLAEFNIRQNSRTRLEAIFEEFAPEEYNYKFEKTRVLVKLLQSDYVSRSEAKRLLHNLDKFSEIELDMRDVERIGQGFADEVFRVFASAHSEIKISAINAGKAAAAMIRHVGGVFD